MSDTDPQIVRLRSCETFFDYQDLLDAADSFAEKANKSNDRCWSHSDEKDYQGTKIFLERLAAGFGGLISYLTGVEIKMQQSRVTS